MGIYLIFTSNKIKGNSERNSSKMIYVCCFVLGLCVCVISQLATYAGKLLPSAVLFAVSGGGSVIIGTVLGALFFKEKLTVKSVLGVVLGITSLLIIRM